jgi:hypothetical protein
MSHTCWRCGAYIVDNAARPALGVPERAVMEFMGWSNSAMAKRYQHVTAVLRNDIAKRLSGFLWQESPRLTERQW